MSADSPCRFKLYVKKHLQVLNGNVLINYGNLLVPNQTQKKD